MQIFNLKEQSKPENYVDDIKQALDYLHKEVLIGNGHLLF